MDITWITSPDYCGDSRTTNVIGPVSFTAACDSIGDTVDWTNWTGRSIPTCPTGYTLDVQPVTVDEAGFYCNTLGNSGYQIYQSEEAMRSAFNCMTVDSCSREVYIGGSCRRSSYTADPTKCCLSNYSETGTGCVTGLDTCDPAYRDMISSGCETPMINYCSTNFLSPECQEYLPKKLFGTQDLSTLTKNQIAPCKNVFNLDYDPDGFYVVSKIVESAISSLAPRDIQEFCCEYTGVCDSALWKACSDGSSDMSLCGCHLENYDEYPGVPPECTPYCSVQGVIPLWDYNNHSWKNCEENICIIDDVSLELYKTTVGGDIYIDQICGSCGGSTKCSCIISSDKYDISNSTIGGSIIDQENCGNISCNVRNPNGKTPEYISTDCKTVPTLNVINSRLEKLFGVTNSKSVIWNVVIAVLIILFFVIVSVWMLTRKK